MARISLDMNKATEAVVKLAKPGALESLLAAQKIQVADDADDLQRAKILLTAVKSQGDFAALLVNVTHAQGKKLEADEITLALAAAFPGANIGKRHGPHYLCLARTGKLEGVIKDIPAIPFAARKKAEATKKPEETKAVAAPEKKPEETKVEPEVKAEIDLAKLSQAAGPDEHREEPAADTKGPVKSKLQQRKEAAAAKKSQPGV